MAMLIVLESLSPLERAAFVLTEVFGMSAPEVADALDRSPAAVVSWCTGPGRTSRPGSRATSSTRAGTARSPSGSWQRPRAVT